MLKKTIIYFTLSLAAFCATTQNTVAQDTIPRPEIYFSPKGGVTAAIVREIEAAKKEISILAYSFTSADIAGALVKAKKRGVVVRVVLDKSQKSNKYSSADFLAHADIETFIDSKHAIQHNKVIIIDGCVVLTGSFNFTKAAEEKNAENLIIFRDEKLAAIYLENWSLHRKHADAYFGR